MYKFVGSSILALVVLMTFAPSTDGLKCHVCSSYKNNDCGDPFVNDDGSLKTKDYLQECPSKNPKGGNYTICRKIYQNVRGDERVIRSCGYEEYKRECYKTVLEEYNTYVCQCKDDSCNSSSYTKISIIAVFASIILSALLGH